MMALKVRTVFNNPNSVTPVATFPSAGSYAVRFIIYDDQKTDATKITQEVTVQVLDNGLTGTPTSANFRSVSGSSATLTAGATSDWIPTGPYLVSEQRGNHNNEDPHALAEWSFTGLTPGTNALYALVNMPDGNSDSFIYNGVVKPETWEPQNIGVDFWLKVDEPVVDSSGNFTFPAHIRENNLTVKRVAIIDDLTVNPTSTAGFTDDTGTPVDPVDPPEETTPTVSKGDMFSVAINKGDSSIRDIYLGDTLVWQYQTGGVYPAWPGDLALFIAGPHQAL